MLLPRKALEQNAAEEREYDAVVVGSGIAGAIIASELSKKKKSVLILESGIAQNATLSGYESYVQRFYSEAFKDNQSPYAPNPNSPMPRSSDARRIWPGHPDASGYLVQNGPFSTDTTYTRVMGGTTLHWEAKVLRMLPEDFQMRSLFGQGADWPLRYEDLATHYEQAEFEIGVSADVAEQSYGGVQFPSGYVFPMRGLPLSYLDRMVAKGIDGTSVQIDGTSYPLKVRSFPQGRNGIPHPDYRHDGRKGYRPVGAISTNQVEVGQRCQGNNACVPICPIQAKYNAGKTLAKALQSKCVELRPQAVASKVHFDPTNGRVTGIEYQHYKHPASPEHEIRMARGKIYVLCANAIENPRLMLASGLPDTSGLIGRNLMDHAYLLSWALMPDACGTMRGTNCTGGIVGLRGGRFRKQQAAFSVDIHNDGWGWAMGSPLFDLLDLVDAKNLFGRELKHTLGHQLSRQLQLAFMLEVLPSPSNRVSVDPGYRDALNNMRPVISYTVPEYTMRGAQYAREFAKTVFQRLGAGDYTAYDPEDYGYATYEGEGYVIRGGNHLAGTHVMGTNPRQSVVNPDQRSWAHDNLYVVGGGSMPSIGTANVTLTIAALCFKSAQAMLRQLC